MRDAIKQLAVLALAALSQAASALAGRPTVSEPVVPAVSAPQPIAFADQQPGGLLRQRLEKHLDRMEEKKYQPDQFFLTTPKNDWQWKWAGDMEGRSLLALVLDAQAAGRTPKYLDTILERFPAHLNSKGYFGEVHPAGIAAEEQLSGNSWTLRALCETYLWKKDKATLELARRLVKELFLPLSGYYYASYPIRPEDRVHDGGVQGETRKVLNYIASSDILSSFIPIDGMTQFYSLEPSPELKKVIDEAVARFLEVDLLKLKAQTHASLSSMRGILRWYSLTGDRKLLDAIVERFSIYENCAMSENYENWNWFGRPEWTEPCAIVDSLLVAMDLWRYTGEARWLEDAHMIAVNAVGATQRANGGFGLDSCPGANGSPWLTVHTPEAHWCCTMRGGEGLSRLVQYAWFLEPSTATLAFPGDNRAVLRLGDGALTVVQESCYPENFGSRLNIEAANISEPVTLRLFAPSFTSGHTLTVNGASVSAEVENGYISVNRTWKAGDSIVWDFKPVTRWCEPRNKSTPAGWRTLQVGPLILCAVGDGKTPVTLPANAPEILVRQSDGSFLCGDVKLTTVHHRMDPRWLNPPTNGEARQVLFRAAATGGAAPVGAGKLKAGAGPVAGAVLQWDASTLKLADGAPVTALANLGSSGSTLDASPTSGTPTFNAPGSAGALNGRGTIHLTGTQGLQTAGNLGITGNSDRSIFVVMRHGESGGNSMTVAMGPQSDPAGVSYGICDQFGQGPGNLYLPYAHDPNDLIVAAPSGGSYRIYEVTRSGNISYGYLNGALQGSKNVAINTSDGKVQVGHRSADGVLANGDVAEVLIYNSFLNDAQRQQVEAYLAAKWFGGNLCANTALAGTADGRYTDRSLAAMGITSVRRGVVSDSPARTWERAMVTGNGIQGAMAMGRTVDETIVLNHAGLFLPLYKPFPTVNQAKILPEVRRMLAEGKFEAAADRVFVLGQEEGKDGTTWTDPFVPACSLQVGMPPRGSSWGYLRSTDFATGVTGTRWEDEAGLHMRRLFVSRPDNVVVLSLTGTNGVDCDLSFILHDPKVGGAAPPPGPDAVKDAAADAEAGKNGGWLTFRVSYTRRWPGSLQGCEVAARVIAPGGTTTAANGKLTVRGARDVLVLVRTTLSRDIGQSQLSNICADLCKLDGSYDKLLARHAAVHGEIMKRCQLDLGGSEADHRLTAPALFAKSKVGALNAALLEKEFDACRCLALSSSGPEYPPALQGIWGATWAPAWSGDYTQNGNLQTVVSGNLMANMPEAMEGFFHYLEAQLPDYRDNARRLFAARGIHVPSRTSTHGLLDQFLRECPVTFWTAGAAWNAQFFYDYWLTTGDKKFLLEHALPWMKEAAAFYEDFLYAGPDGKWEFNPSFSPENNGKAPGFAMGAINSAIDTGAARELFSNLVTVCGQLGLERDNVAKWKGILAKMPDYKINTDGAVAEWNTPLLHDCYGHRHASHLYGLYAGLPADIASNPALQAAFKVAIEKRMQCRRANNGGDMAFGLCQLGWPAASLHDGETAYEAVDWLANNFWFAESMVTSHNIRSIFNTDIAGGLPRIILTMLVQAEPGRLELLPALPKAWPTGRVTGILCRGQIEVRELTWHPDEIVVTLRSAVTQQVAVRHDGLRALKVISGSATAGAPQADGSRLVALPEGRDVTLRLARATAETYAAKVKPVVPYKAEPFGFDEVRLLDGYLKNAQDLDAKFLLSLDINRLVAPFRKEAGLPKVADSYPGWESSGILLPGVGCSFYLSGCAMLYASTGDTRFADRIDRVLAILEECQKTGGDGFVLGVPGGRKVFREFEKGDIRLSSTYLYNDVATPYYAMEKLFSGLRDAYRIAGRRKALEIATRFGGWLERHMAGLSDENMQKLMIFEYGGMNWVLSDLYVDTGEKRFQDMSKRWWEKALYEPLLRGEDNLPGRHTNTQFPKISGLLASYPYTADSNELRIAEFFWDRVVHFHSYVNGGSGFGEFFGPPGKLNDRLEGRTAESCNVFNMLRMTRLLFCIDPRPDLAEYFERGLYNQILAQQHPVDGRVCYYLPLAAGQSKRFDAAYDSFSCCVCSSMESHARHASFIYMRDAEGLYVNLFAPSELRWKARGVTLRQETRFPDEDAVKLSFQCASPTKFTVKLRHPAWSPEMGIQVNGQAVAAGKAGEYVAISRKWKTGDRVEIKLAMPLRTESMPDNPKRIAFFKGPILLAGVLGSQANVPTVIPKASPLETWFSAVPDTHLELVTDGVLSGPDVTLKPFFKIHEGKYVVYWDTNTGHGKQK